MAKFKEKIKAQKLRKHRGYSIKDIAKKLNVSKGSVSIWCRNIKLTKNQIACLDKKQKKGGYKGRLKGARTQRKKYLEKVKNLNNQGLKQVGKLNKRDLFIAGIGLYWGEGSKTENRVGFHNSDPQIIRCAMRWFREILLITEERFTIYFIVNEIHKNRLDKITKYWSKITKIPIEQFRKPVLARVKNKKVYNNFHKHFGTLTIRINKSSSLFYRIQGYIKSFSHNDSTPRNATTTKDRRLD